MSFARTAGSFSAASRILTRRDRFSGLPFWSSAATVFSASACSASSVVLTSTSNTGDASEGVPMARRVFMASTRTAADGVRQHR